MEESNYSIIVEVSMTRCDSGRIIVPKLFRCRKNAGFMMLTKHQYFATATQSCRLRLVDFL